MEPWRQLDAPSNPVPAERADARVARLELVARACTAAVRADEVLTILLRQALAGLGASRATVALVDGDRSIEPVLSAGSGPSDVVLNLAHALVLTHAAATGAAVVCETPASLVARFPALADLGPPTGAVAAVPLVQRGCVVAVLGVAFDAPRRVDAVERSFLQGLADVASLGLAVAAWT